MLRQRTFGFVLAAAVTIALGSCSDDTSLPSAPSSPSVTTPDLALAGAQQDLADDPVALARSVPGFGGFFVDQQGTPTVYLANPGGRAAAELALAPWFRERNRPTAALRVLPAQFAWTDLERWFAQASTEVLAVPGVVFTDADEAGNRVRIGVEHAAAASRVRSALARLGIPAAAANVEIVAPIRRVANLRGPVRPVVAGVQINFPGFLCSLGFNATRQGVAGFVTASHCTTTQGGVESTPYWQPLQTTRPVQIGTETVDPTYKTTLAGCPSGRRCRRSDAAFARYVNATPKTLGRIARTAIHELERSRDRGRLDDHEQRHVELVHGRRDREQGRPHHRMEPWPGGGHLRHGERQRHDHHPDLPDHRYREGGQWRQRLRRVHGDQRHQRKAQRRTVGRVDRRHDVRVQSVRERHRRAWRAHDPLTGGSRQSPGPG